MEISLHLESLKIGSEVCVFWFDECGSRNYGEIYVVLGFHEKLKRWEYGRPSSKSSLRKPLLGLIPQDGYFTTPAVTKLFSANPLDLEQARKARDLRMEKAKERLQQDAENLSGFLNELEIIKSKYGVELFVNQLSGDDQGVEFEIVAETSLNSKSID